MDEEARVAKAMRIEIDLSKLADIRAAADVTRDKLIVDEETEEPAPEPVSEPEAAQVADSPLNEAETAFLRALLTGGEASAAAKSAGTMPSLLADSINEKLFDVFADTVIDCSADVPEIIEDYVDELKNYV